MSEFYVYRIFNAQDETLYIGKGSGNRLSAQISRFKESGEVLETFVDENQAFARERELIAEINPPLNKTAGGDGGRSGPSLMQALAVILRKLHKWPRVYLLGQDVTEDAWKIARSMIDRIGPDKARRGLKKYNINLVIENSG